jgi:hypothetical protein
MAAKKKDPKKELVEALLSTENLSYDDWLEKKHDELIAERMTDITAIVKENS